MRKQLTVSEAAARLGVTTRRVIALIEAGRLPATRFGRAYGLGGWVIAASGRGRNYHQDDHRHGRQQHDDEDGFPNPDAPLPRLNFLFGRVLRSEEHTSELQSHSF